MKIKKIISIAIVIAMCLGSLVGCSTKQVDDVKASEKNILTYGSNDYSRINSALDEHGEIHKLIFSGLTKHDENNKVIPDLAESWSYDESNYTYTFKLKHNVKWHDGKEFTAEDVKFTIDTIKEPKNNSEISSNYQDVKNVEVVDKYTVNITLLNHNVAILDYLSTGIIPKHLLEGKDIQNDEFNKKPIGTGIYKFSDWKDGQYIKLNSNNEYYGNVPKIDEVVFKIIPDDKAKAMQLKSGEIDIAQIDPKDISMFENDKQFTTYQFKTADYRGLMYNFNKPLFKENKEVIKALSYSVNRKAIIDGVLMGMGESAYSPLQLSEYNNKDIEKYEYNPTKSRQILEDAGWKLNNEGIYQKGNQKLEFNITCFDGDQVRIDMATIASQNFKEIGVNAKVDIQSDIDWANLDSFLIGWGSPFDPDDHTYKVFHSSQIESGMNLNGYINPKVDKALEKARSTDNNEDRIKYYKEFQEEMSNDLPFTFIAYIDYIYIYKSDIKGIDNNKVLGHHGVGMLWNIEDWDVK
jgi:peptide/nickel transport system substrate-binding protein